MAHCNFHLRGDDSNRDECFVRQLAESYGVRCHVAQFDTRSYAADNHLSIEEAARQLRYQFFATCVAEWDNACVVTAHHRDDAVETFFLNLLRGTGIAGLVGMRPSTLMTCTHPAIRVVHPLLSASRNDIVRYAELHGLEHVEDATNQSLLYRRNRIRHQLLPLLHQMTPAADQSIEQTMQHLADAEVIYRHAIERVRDQLVRHLPEGDVMAVESLRQLQPLRTWLFELLRPYGFNAAQVDDIQEALNGQSGRRFYSATHRLVRERTTLVVTPYAATNLAAGDGLAEEPLCRMQIFSREQYLQTYGSFRVCLESALFDADRLRQPTHWRHPRPGDRFCPFGMKGSRLVSDLLSDMKRTTQQREQQWLLCDADDTVLWVVGLRADGRYAVSDDTRQVLLVTLV